MEALVGSETGELAILADDGLIGTVYIEQGEICWAVDRRSSVTLAQRLCARSDVPVERLRETVDECLRTKEPLGETLVARGLVSAEALREVLFEHTSDALCRVSFAARELRFNPRARSYDPRFRFSGVDLVTHVARRWSPVWASHAEAVLAAACGDYASGFGFVREFGKPGLLVAHVRGTGLPVTGLPALYEDAAHVEVSCQRAFMRYRSVLFVNEEHSGTVVWRDGPVLFVGRTSGAAHLARMVAYLREHQPPSQTSSIGLGGTT
ncbi:MAG TPA: hypothetical protein PLR99_02755 [Polyangiaceae bacterium]|jgi:hypothetical protein|nr:hypothetical protein [Polyangiaceae bacterium]